MAVLALESDLKVTYILQSLDADGFAAFLGLGKSHRRHYAINYQIGKSNDNKGQHKISAEFFKYVHRFMVFYLFQYSTRSGHFTQIPDKVRNLIYDMQYNF